MADDEKERLERVRRTLEETAPIPGVDHEALMGQAIGDYLDKREEEARAAREPSLWRRIKTFFIRW